MHNLTCVLDQSPACGNFPELGNRILSSGQNILGVFGEDGRADLSPIVGFIKGSHTPVRHSIPQFDAAIFATGDVAVGTGIVADSADGVCVLI